jgi:glycosyltransferase involved in cell wall biosynthesis
MEEERLQAKGVSSTFPEDLKGKRVLLATESFGPVNGVSRTTLSLVEYLRQHGVDVAVVAPRYGEKRKMRASRFARVNIRLSGQPLPYNPDLTVVHPFRYDRVCTRTFKPDLVYLASPASVGFQFLLQIRQLQEPPVVFCNFQTDLSAYSQIIFPAGMDRFAVWLLGLVQGFLFNHRSVHTIFYPSLPIRDYLTKVGAPPNKLMKLGRGVDTSAFNPSNRDDLYRKSLAPGGEIILICVCRLAPEKGFDFLAKVAEALQQRSLPFRLLIVGGNRNPSVEKDVRRSFQAVQNHVTFTGFLTGDALARAYAAGDLFLHCSVTETFGLVVLEAMASGMPVIARDQGGPSEIVQEGETGYLVAPNDLDLFVTRTINLAQNKESRLRMSEAALRQANDTTWEKINQRVAWKLAEGIDWHKEQATIRGDGRPIKNWLWKRYLDLKIAFLLPLTQLLRLHAAVGIVCFFWIIAVLPLILHGNSVFPGQWSPVHILRDLFWKVPSQVLKQK